MNPQKDLDKLVETLKREGKVPSLLLHSCCAPCSTYCIEYLSQYFRVTVFYYNPNIFPEEEYEFRKSEQRRFIESFGTVYPVEFIEGDYESKLYNEAVKGLENEPEGGKRCEKCFKLRLGKTARLAIEKEFDYFATTLTISPLKNQEVINRIGLELTETLGSAPNRALEKAETIDPTKKTCYLPTDFKKKNGYLRSTEISKEYSMYRQNFCGCEFSMRQESVD